MNPAVDGIGWRHFPHEADIGICGFGPRLEIAFAQAGLALTAVVTDAAVALDEAVTVTCRAPAPDLLFVAWLNELIFEMDTRGLVFGRYALCISGQRLCCAAYGEPVDRARHAPACEVKGATYTALSVDRNAQGLWIAQCVVDV
jgi:tRNA nucleotidyltransferase (CCA-adding enzyme)